MPLTGSHAVGDGGHVSDHNLLDAFVSAAPATYVALEDPTADAPALGLFFPEAHGAVGDGTTDDTTAILAADTAANVTGGTVCFQAKTYRIDGRMVLANDGAVTPTVPRQRNRRWEGAGGHFSGQGSAVYGGTVLDMRYTGGGSNLSKLLTKGLGTLVFEHITFTDGGTSSNPFIKSTNTTIFTPNCAFIGNSSKNQATCDQDAIILGGTTTTLGSGEDAPFQGYGTIIEKTFFNRIRAGVVLQTYANAVIIRENTWWINCGSDATSGAVVIQPLAGESVAGTVMIGNLIEMGGYVYGVNAINDCVNGTFIGNNFYDPDAGVLAYHRFGATGGYNLVIPGFAPDTYPTMLDASNSNTLITSHAGQTSEFSGPVEFSNATGVTFSGPLTSTKGAGGVVLQPGATQVGGASLLQAKRSAAEGTNPGTTIFDVTYQGQLFLGGALPQLLFQDAAGTSVGVVSAGGITRSGSGGALLFDSGSGGSYTTFRGFGVKILDYLGTLTVTLKVGSGSPEGAFAAPVGSVWFRTDGGAATSFYVKESGTGTTGWVAK